MAVSDWALEFIARSAGTTRAVHDFPPKSDCAERIAAMTPKHVTSEPLTGNIDEKLDHIWSRLNEVGWVLTHMEQLCPYHDLIVELKSVPAKMEDLENKVQTLQIRMAVFGAIGGLAGSLVGPLLAKAIASYLTGGTL